MSTVSTISLHLTHFYSLNIHYFRWKSTCCCCQLFLLLVMRFGLYWTHFTVSDTFFFGFQNRIYSVSFWKIINFHSCGTKVTTFEFDSCFFISLTWQKTNAVDTIMKKEGNEKKPRHQYNMCECVSHSINNYFENIMLLLYQPVSVQAIPFHWCGFVHTHTQFPFRDAAVNGVSLVISRSLRFGMLW